MAKQRLNDTAAFRSVPSSGNTSHSVSVRKIDNGYVESTSDYNSMTGESKYSERFSEMAPDIGRVNGPRAGVGPDVENRLSDTMRYLNNDK